jgi:hypothetical protein
VTCVLRVESSQGSSSTPEGQSGGTVVGGMAALGVGQGAFPGVAAGGTFITGSMASLARESSAMHRKRCQEIIVAPMHFARHQEGFVIQGDKVPTLRTLCLHTPLRTIYAALPTLPSATPSVRHIVSLPYNPSLPPYAHSCSF